MLQWLASFLTAPLIEGAISAYKAKLAAGNDADRIAADLAGRELAVQEKEVEVQGQLRIALIGHWYEPTNLLGYILVIYFGKIVLWDKVFGYWTDGSTDPITGAAGEWAGMIMIFLVGKRGIENVAKILKR